MNLSFLKLSVLVEAFKVIIHIGLYKIKANFRRASQQSFCFQYTNPLHCGQMSVSKI
jgi:hypothetical protein